MADLAVVDDNDPLVHYAGTWTQSGASEEFQQTTHCTQQQGATASFSFVGTSVAVYGTVAFNHTDAAMEFLVDNSVKGNYVAQNFTGDTHHQLFYQSPTLTSSDGSNEHTLLITQTAIDTLRCILYLDFLTYGATSASNASNYFIDDRDARVVYQPAWSLFGSEQDFMHTSQQSPSKGAQFTLTFEGRGISYYGGITAGNSSNASITIDDGPPTYFVPQSAPGIVSVNNLYYSSGDLKDGQHKLVAVAENANAIWTDYFLVIPPLPSTTTSTGGGPAGGGTTGTGSNGTPTNAADTTSGSPSVASSSKTSAGTIAGSVVGVLVLVGLLVGAFVFFILRRRRKAEAEEVPVHPRPAPDMSSYRSPQTTPGPSVLAHDPFVTPFNGNSSMQVNASHSNPALEHADAPLAPQRYPYQSPHSPSPPTSVAGSGSLSASGQLHVQNHHPNQASLETNEWDGASLYSGAQSTSSAGVAGIGAAALGLSPNRGVPRKLQNEARFTGTTSRADGMEGPPTYIE